MPHCVEQLRQGTVKVKEALGPSYAVSDEKIEEALWHYYYDVAKTVSYLKSRLAKIQWHSFPER